MDGIPYSKSSPEEGTKDGAPGTLASPNCTVDIGSGFLPSSSESLVYLCFYRNVNSYHSVVKEVM